MGDWKTERNETVFSQNRSIHKKPCEQTENWKYAAAAACKNADPVSRAQSAPALTISKDNPWSGNDGGWLATLQEERTLFYNFECKINQLPKHQRTLNTGNGKIESRWRVSRAILQSSPPPPTRFYFLNALRPVIDWEEGEEEEVGEKYEIAKWKCRVIGIIGMFSRWWWYMESKKAVNNGSKPRVELKEKGNKKTNSSLCSLGVLVKRMMLVNSVQNNCCWIANYTDV